jgi:hypothetical protein
MNALATWRFRQMQPGEMNIDPIEAEFFSTEALGSLGDALVREAIQNSLDARRPGELLRMRIYFPEPDAFLEGERRTAYLQGLAPHLQASRSGLTIEALPERDEPLSFISIEDFGTRGLQGDPAQSEDDELDAASTRNDFFFFWRNVGRSRKHAAELGRWGLGKTVFQAASRINSFFALTVRANDERRLLLGQSVLKIHRLEGKRFYPYGYFGRFEADFALPIETSISLDDFARDFGLERRGAPGLSVVLPYPDTDLTPGTVTESVLRHYFMPILAGDLSVEIQDGSRIETLDHETLPRMFAAAGQGTAFKRIFDLARWSIVVPRDEHARLAPPSESAAPRWDDEAIDARIFGVLRERFDAGRPIAVTAPVWVKPVGQEPRLSEFDVYLQRDETLERADEHFVRDGITITGVRATLPRGIRLIVSIRERALSTLVGDSENPAHTEWQERSLKFKGRYHHGPFTLRYLKNVPRELVRLLTRPAEGRDYALLKQLFSLDVPTEDEILKQTGRRDSPGEGGEIETSITATVGQDRLFALQKLRGGFRIKGVSGLAETPRAAAIWVAYEVRRGNPFHHYQPLDFELSKPPIEIDERQLSIAACHENRLVLRPQSPDFELTVRGFDEHRDLRIKVLPAEEAAA